MRNIESLPITLLKVPKDVYSSFIYSIQIELKKSRYREIFMNLRDAGIGVHHITFLYIYNRTISNLVFKRNVS